MMDRSLLLELVETLGREFERRGMRSHLESLRLYYLAVRRHLDRRHAVRISWDEAMTVEWLALLRLPPYEAQYPVREVSYRCRCGQAKHGAPEPKVAGDWSHIGRGSGATELVFPGGYKAHCRDCGAAWLVLTPASDEPSAAGVR